MPVHQYYTLRRKTAYINFIGNKIPEVPWSFYGISTNIEKAKQYCSRSLLTQQISNTFLYILAILHLQCSKASEYQFQGEEETRIASKYLVERSYFFSKSYLVLSLQEDNLHMQPLSRDWEDKDGGVLKIDWENIVQVQASERNPREFTLFTVPPNKKKGQGSKQTNTQQILLQCKERNRLLTEIIHKIHVKNDGGMPLLVQRASFQSDIYNNDSLQGVILKIHPSVIQVVVKKDKKLSNKKIDSQNKEEGKTENSQDERFTNQIDDQEDDNLLQEYESDIQNNNTHVSIMTPFKGSMLGGTLLGEGEDSALAGDKNNLKQHFIYICEIDRVFAINEHLVIVKNNQEIEKFYFKDEEAMKEVLDLMKKLHRDHFKKALYYFIFQTFEQDKIFEEVDFVRYTGKVCYSQDVSAVTWEGLIPNLQIQLDETCIYEIEKTENRIRKRCQYRDLELVRIVDKNQSYNLVLLFKKETEFVLKIPSIQEREKLLSAILTLRNFILPNSGYADKLTILVNSSMDLSQTILGHDPLEQAPYTLEYEILLFKKLAENINYKDSMKINNLIEEILLNTSFALQIKLDQRQIKIILKEVQQCLEGYLNFEINESHIVDALFKKWNYDELIDYFQYKKKKHMIINNDLVKKTDEQLKNDILIHFDNSTQNNTLFDEGGIDKIKIFQSIFERTSRYLSVLHHFLNSKSFLQEMQDHEELMLLLIKILVSKCPYMGLLSSQVIQAISQHYSGSENRIEQINKKIMIRGKHSSIQQAINLPTEQNNQNDFELGENLYLFHAIFEYMQYFETLQENQSIIKSLHLFNISNILRSILHIRKQSTGKEELQIFAQFLIVEDQIQLLNEYEKKQYFQIIDKASGNKQVIDDPLRNKPLFHLIDKFSLFGPERFDIQYLFTLIMNESLGYFKKYELDKLQDFQVYILTYSIQFIWNLYILMDSPIKEQRKLSINVLAKLLYQNQESIQLLLRCFPKTLIERVETPIELMTSLAWQESEWEEFFTLVTQKKYDTATEQWNDETRKELKEKLQQELAEFIEAKNIHKQVLQDGSKKQLILPNHEFNRNKQVISRRKNLKWNYMEFQVKYNCLNHQYLVWKYYLTKLLEEKNIQERQRPFFTQVILKPIVFWNELKIKFMSSFDPEEQKIILKTMCVLYNNHHEQLKELKSIPYLVKLLDQEQFEHCHFILLQLIQVALSIQSENSSKNLKKFIKADGLRIVLNCMKLVFKDLNVSEKVKQLQIDYHPQLMVLSALNRDEYEKVVHGPIAMKDQANYSNSDTNSRYFKRNSEYVCMGILSLKILDLIFKEMSSIDYVPLPTNREFLMKPESLAVITQMLMVQNTDLTRELTIFVQAHLNNHYSLFKLIYSGMIEFLVLSMSSRNGDRALDILEKFQEVCIGFNTKLKFGLFNSNDLEMIQSDQKKNEEKLMKLQDMLTREENKDRIKDIQDMIIEIKRQTVLSESIFLRFLPIPFIKYLYEKGKQSFLQIYKMQNYEHPILIWNADLRQQLENTIIQHAEVFILELKEFAKMPSKQIKQQENFPFYSDKKKSNKFKNIVKYTQIDNEVRCGRYYLRVWVNQKRNSKDYFKIPGEEEKDFYKNLQTELRHCIYEEQFKNHQKIIILFKASLRALQDFNEKGIMSLDEVKRILVDTCKNQDVYNETVKEIVYLGIKIIHLAMESAENLKIILTKNCAEIIGEIFSLILKHSFNSKHLSKSFTKNFNQDESIEEPNNENENNGVQGKILEEQIQTLQSQNQRIQVDIIEAKTLSLCVQSFNTILNSDIQAFVDYPLEQRISLFRQIARILDLSFSLIPLFGNRELNNNEIFGDSKTYSSSYYGIQPTSPRGKSKDRQSKTRKKSRNRDQSHKRQILNTNMSTSQNAIAGVLANNYYQDKYISSVVPNAIKQNKTSKRKLQYKKDSNIDYHGDTLINIIKKHKENSYPINLIFDITRATFELTQEITKYPVLHPELIASGMAWKTLLYIYFYLKDEVKKFKDLEASLKSATISLKNLISFAQELKGKGVESFAFKNLTKEKEREIMSKFQACISRIFGTKILETLLSPFNIANNVLVFPNYYEPRIFLELFSVEQQEQPELVWNDETRRELYDALLAQVQKLQMHAQSTNINFYEILSQFDYSVNLRELRVENIFVRHYNHSDNFKYQESQQIVPSNKQYFRKRNDDFDKVGFAGALIKKLKETINGKYLVELAQDENQNCIELVKAFKNLLIIENLEIEQQDTFDDYISTFCNMIKVKPDQKQQNDIEIARLKEMNDLIFDILRHITKNGGAHFEKLKENIDFIRLLIRALYGKEKEIKDMDNQVIEIFKQVQLQEIDMHAFLIQTGLIMFILNIIFDKNVPKRIRVECVKFMLQTSIITEPIYRRFIPKYFFYEIQQKYNNDTDLDRLLIFLKDFDAPEFDNVFIIWNTQLMKESHQRIKDNCEKIVNSDSDSNFSLFLGESEFYNPFLDNEIMVCDVILRIYNKNPAVFIGTKLNSFILDVSTALQTVAQELFKMSQTDDPCFEEDFIPQTVQQQKLQKKFKYLCYKSTLMLTTILLSIEQLLYNDFNPNRLMAYKKEEKTAEAKFHKQIIDKATETTQLDQKVYPILNFWLQTQVFLGKNIPIDIKLMFLQIIYLIIEVADAVKILKDNLSLMQFITDSIDRINKDEKSMIVEDALILFITYRMLRKDHEPIPILLTTSMSKLLKIHEKKNKLRKIIEFVLQWMAQDSQYRSAVIENIKLEYSQKERDPREHIDPGSKIDIKAIQEGSSMNSDYAQAILGIWRAKPTSVNDAKRIYDYTEAYKIDDGNNNNKISELNILKIKLPLLSKKSIQIVSKEDMVEENKLTNKHSDLNFANDIHSDLFIGGAGISNKNISAQLGFDPMFMKDMPSPVHKEIELDDDVDDEQDDDAELYGK